MLKDDYEQIRQGENLREAISHIRSEIKEDEVKDEFCALIGEGTELIELLEVEDAKARKNGALLIGELGLENAVDALFLAYQKEKTLFAKSAYLTALSKLDASAHLEFFKERLHTLKNTPVPEEEKKHTNEEIKELDKIITGIEGFEKHEFSGFEQPHDILLTTNREQREVTLKEVAELSATVQRKAELHPLGVKVFSKEVIPFSHLRTFRELLFPIRVEKRIEKNPKQAAELIWNAGIYEFLEECHTTGGAFRFRLEVKGADTDILFVKKLSAALEQLSDWKLVNATTDYEVEIRLMEMREGGYLPFIKLFTLSMKRFAYRKNAISMSIHPATAAMLMQLAKPYLKEGAQILDPCCGVGTMLIERDYCVPSGDKYGIDVYGDAIEMGRENAALASKRINFIHRNYFDFKHEYGFDEIVTNMPIKGRKTKDEMDAFYASFFEKSEEILSPGGIIIMYSNEIGFVKKQLRLQTSYRLLQEFCIRKKDNYYLFIIEMKG